MIDNTPVICSPVELVARRGDEFVDRAARIIIEPLPESISGVDLQTLRCPAKLLPRPAKL